MSIDFELKGEYIALCDLLKLCGVASSGGQGKQMVADGIVRVDDVIEHRKTAKIRRGQTVNCLAQTIKIV